MALLLITIVVVVLGAIALALVTAARRRSRHQAVPDMHGLLWQFAGLLVGCIVCVVTVRLEVARQQLVLALPSLAGSCWLLSIMVAELTRRRRQSGAVRVAGLVPRTPGRYVMRWALVGMRSSFAVTAAVALAAALLASPSGSTQISAAWSGGRMISHGPWPGWYYSLPALAGLVVGWLLTELTVRTVVGRAPAVGDPDADERVRVQAVRAAVVAASLVAAPVLGALLLAMGACIASVSLSDALHGLAWGMRLVGGGLVLASGVAWAGALVSGGRAVVPGVVER
jgi:hypothetical protein